MKTKATFAQLADAVRAMSKPLYLRVRPPYGPVERGLFGALFRARDRGFVRLKEIGIARRIWGTDRVAFSGGAKSSNLGTYAYPIPLGADGRGGLVMGLRLSGIPAMIEAGGRTKPHKILPTTAKLRTRRQKLPGDLLGSLSVLGLRVRASRRMLVARNRHTRAGILRLANGQFIAYAMKHSARVPKVPWLRPELDAEMGQIEATLRPRLVGAMAATLEAA